MAIKRPTSGLEPPTFRLIRRMLSLELRGQSTQIKMKVYKFFTLKINDKIGFTK
jgi:hypothetical protein